MDDSAAPSSSQSDNKYYFYAQNGQLCYFDDFRNVYTGDGTLVHEENLIFRADGLFTPNFNIDGAPFWFDEAGLISRDHDGTLHRVQTWQSEQDLVPRKAENLTTKIKKAPLGPLAGSFSGGPALYDMPLDSNQGALTLELTQISFATKSNLRRHFPTHGVGSLEHYQPGLVNEATGSGAICKHLINNGCSDLSGKIVQVDESPMFSGEISDIFQGQLTNGIVVAVKCLRPPTRNDQPNKTLKRTAHELFVWSLMTHPNVLELLGFAMHHDKLALVIPWIQYGSLLSYIKANPEVDRSNLCLQVAEGLVYVHGLGIIHGDLRGDNVTVSEDGTARITNFASATMKQEFAMTFTATKGLHYSIRWAAPELFSGTSGTEADVYALGMTILETLTGDVPHKNRGDLAVVHAVLVRKQLPNRPSKDIPPTNKGNELWAMLQRCWNYNPVVRPKAAEVRDLPTVIEEMELDAPRTAPAQPGMLSSSEPNTPLSNPGSRSVVPPVPIEFDGPTGSDVEMLIEEPMRRVPGFIIKRDTDLPTIVRYLVDNGCVDVTSQLTNVSGHLVFSGKQSDVYQAQLPDGTAVAVKCLRELTSSGHANPEADRCNLCGQIAEGLAYMHAQGVAHGDMKGSNVVVSETGIAKITDFGCATLKREFPVSFTATESLQYSLRWAAPEMFEEDGASSFATDVYAFGMTILEVLSGEVPYRELGDLAVIRAVLVKRELPKRPHTSISPKSAKGDELWNLMMRCWHIDSRSRPTIQEIRDF
ncbi:hypothetical protein FRC11_004515, partial [Ceratobasidium sp. 423]